MCLKRWLLTVLKSAMCLWYPHTHTCHCSIDLVQEECPSVTLSPKIAWRPAHWPPCSKSSPSSSVVSTLSRAASAWVPMISASEAALMDSCDSDGGRSNSEKRSFAWGNEPKSRASSNSFATTAMASNVNWSVRVSMDVLCSQSSWEIFFAFRTHPFGPLKIDEQCS